MEELTPRQIEDERMVNEAYQHLVDTYMKSRHRGNVELINKAFNFAKQAHKGVRRLSGEPYIMHPIAVAQIACEEIGLGSTSICSALLHDVVEDTDYTLEDLAAMGFGEPVIRALGLLTHDASVEYMDYVRAIKEDPIAKAVKLADLRHNSDSSRMDVMTARDLARQEKYRKAMALLEQE